MYIGEYHVDVDTDYKYTDSHSVIKSQKHNDQLSVESPEVIKKSNSDFHCNPRGGTCRNHDDCCLNLACDPKNMLCTVVEFRDEEEDQEKDPKKAVKSTTSSQISSKTRNQRICIQILGQCQINIHFWKLWENLIQIQIQQIQRIFLF